MKINRINRMLNTVIETQTNKIKPIILVMVHLTTVTTVNDSFIHSLLYRYKLIYL